MTPPENTERHGAGGTTDTNAGDVAPPWQRVAKDTGAASTGQDGDGFGDRWSAGQLPNEEAPTAYHGQVPQEQNGNVDTQFVTGTAAAGFFGGQQTEQPTQPRAQYEAQQQAGGGSGKGRSTPVSALRRPGRGPRRASLQIKRFDPWSVLKLSLVLGVAMFLVWLVAVGVLYTVLDGMGVWDKVNGTYTSLVQGDTAANAGEPLISAGRVFGVAAIVGAINIVLISALTTVSAFIYNVSADLAGGLEVTLSERE